MKNRDVHSCFLYPAPALSKEFKLLWISLSIESYSAAVVYSRYSFTDTLEAGDEHGS